MSDISALCAAIDAGDDSALPALADALEEASRESDAQSLRHAIRHGRRPLRNHGGREGYSWVCWSSGWTNQTWGMCPWHLWPERFNPLQGGELVEPHMDARFRAYQSRSAAYLALTEGA